LGETRSFNVSQKIQTEPYTGNLTAVGQDPGTIIYTCPTGVKAEGTGMVVVPNMGTHVRMWFLVNGAKAVRWGTSQGTPVDLAVFVEFQLAAGETLAFGGNIVGGNGQASYALKIRETSI